MRSGPLNAARRMEFLAMTTPGDTTMATLDEVLQVMKRVGARIAR